MSTHGDWTIHALRDGELRLCYAEIKPFASSATAQAEALPVLQVTHEAGRTREPLAQVTVDAEYELFLGDQRDRNWLNVDDLLRGEEEGAELKLSYEPGSGESASATYSLQGLAEAYAALRDACPLRVAGKDEGTLVRAGESRFVQGDQPYIELDLSGPFAEAGKSEPFSVRFYTDRFISPEETFSGAEDPLGRLWSQFTDRLEFWRGEVRAGALDGSHFGEAPRLEWRGVCLDPESERLKALIHGQGGGTGDLGLSSSAWFDPEQGMVRETISYGNVSGDGIADCQDGEVAWGDLFRPCLCLGGYSSTLDELESDFRGTSIEEDLTVGVGDETLAALLARAERLLPFIEWDPYSELAIDRYSSSSYSLALVTYRSWSSWWSAFQYLYGRRNSDDVWKLLYEATVNSKSLHTADIRGFVGPETLELDMCVEIYCGGWGRYETVRIDVGQWLESIGREGDDFLEPVFARAIAEADAARQAAEAAERRQREEEAANAIRAAIAAQAEASAVRKGEMAKVAAELAELAPGMEMVVIPAGSFRMGCMSFDCEGSLPTRDVTIPRPFAVSKHEVTFAQWDACVSSGGCTHRPDDEGWGRDRRPVVNVSWEDAQLYVAWLSEQTGAKYRLLSEAEWEYAVRAGSATLYSWGDGDASGLANCADCGNEWDGARSAPVGSFPANDWGLHDMHGNVWEWVQDCWNDNYVGAPSDGGAWEQDGCSERVVRGASWLDSSQILFSAVRWWGLGRPLNAGIRIARTLAP